MRSPVESPTALDGGLDGATAGAFSYDDAFVRNIGWVTPAEQQILRERRVAVAGLGGVGGSHVLALARLGVGAFHIADFDRFDLANMNRQAGAFMGTMGRPKAEVIAEMVREINPEAEVTVFPEGVAGGASSDAYLAGCDVVLDGLDFFVIDVRRALFAAAAAAGIPAVTAAPLGTGTAWLVFTPEGIGFDRYFDFKDGESTLRQYVKFMIGLSPKGVHRAALVAPERVDFSARAGPSTAMGCQLASAVAVTEALKLLLGRPGLRPAPAFHQFDPVLGRYVSGRQRGGNCHPLRRLQIALGERWIRRIAPKGDPLADSVPGDAPVIEKILDLARWAPSGDNDQPWRFEPRGEEQVRIHIRLQPGENIYEYAQGRPVWLALGGLLESLRLAGSVHGRHCHWDWAPAPARAIDVTFIPAPNVRPARLARYIKYRSVDRRPYRRSRLDARTKAALEAAWGDAFEVQWLESAAERWAATKLNMRATHIRLRIPECHRVHQRVIRFGRAYAEEGLPAAAVGLDPLTTRLMRWANATWWRTKLLNRWLGGARAASLQLDLLPGLSCSAHFAVRWRDETRGGDIEDWLEAGRAMQRFWLEATAQNLVLQPSFAPIIFAHYAESGKADWEISGTTKEAGALSAQLHRNFGAGADRLVFVGRIGRPRYRGSHPRSLRRPIDLS